MRRRASYMAGAAALALLTCVSDGGGGGGGARDHVALDAWIAAARAAAGGTTAQGLAAPGAAAVAASAASELPIAGWIVDGGGAPIAGVRVVRREPGADDPAIAAPAEPASAVSEADGAFRLPPSEAPRVLLALDGPHVFPAELSWRAGDPAPRILLARRVHLEARVTAGGAPAAGAEVQLLDGSGPALATATADEAGVARFRDLVPGPYELWARRGGTVSPLLRIADAADARDLALALEPAEAVRGRVLADGPLPAGGAVHLAPLDVDHAARTAPLDAEGRFALDGLPRGRWRALASVPDHVPDGERVLDARGAAGELVLRVARAGVVAGTVVDPAGAPASGATIVIRAQGAAAPSAARSFAERPAAGPLRLRWVHPLAGPRLLPVIPAARFGATRPGHRAAECGLGHCGVDLGSKRGQIVHAAADGEVAAAFTEIRGEAGRYVAIDHGGGLRTYYMHLDELRPGLEVRQRVRAGDPLGTIGTTGFALDVPHLHFALTQDHHGRAWYVDPEPMLRQAVVLASPRPLEPIDPAGPAGAAAAAPLVAAAPRAELAGEPAAARTLISDAQGRFRLGGVAPGAYVAVAFADGFAPVASAPFTVRSGAETGGVTIALRPGVLVHGRVTGRDGPLDGATVTAAAGFGETAHKVALAYTTRTGEFALRSLIGRVTLTVSAPGHGDVERTLVLDDGGPGRARRREDFALVALDGQVRGQVLAPDGGPPGPVAVRVLEGPSRRGGAADARGQFVLDRVAAGSYLVELSSPEHPPLRARLATGAWKELRFERSGGARVRLSDARSGAPLVGVRVEATGPGGQAAAAATDPQGFAELRGLAIGAWTVSVRSPGYTTGRQAVAVVASRVPADVRIDLQRSAVAGGVVRDRYGRRVAGAKVTLGGATTRTDADGNFRLEGAPAGAGTLEAEHEGARGALGIELAPGDERLTLDVHLAE